ncbi:MAG: hypothetical protein A2161_13365 [Candidatus Schekmanbacteria bacterium RBG_13_48_7]|uniref:DUF4340 domain-containing protein n=1 Tax=Candidatus Schekmanbacteria bacterium RBG_13_48_7 TaxID=1817878 RepID=A0A1F7RRE2_9BACT|nr:MAG: hypothetical protein A2161_13365 [Candidatus Schekmanbacteria bacterium RBG_13_48_7]
MERKSSRGDMKMRKNKVTIISILIICVAVGIYLYSLNQEKIKKPVQFNQFINPETIKQINITKAGETISLTTSDNVWYIKNKDSVLISVDSNKIISIFDFINASDIVQRVTKKESSYPDFDLIRDKETMLVLKNIDDVDTTFYMGKPSENRNSQFVRKGSDPYVYMVSKVLNLDMDPTRWYFRNILFSDPLVIDRIEYNCSDNKKIDIQNDAELKKFLIKDVPEGKQARDLEKVIEQFEKIPVTDYVPRTQEIETEPVVTHNLYFRGGGSAQLAFLKEKKEKSNVHYLDISIDLKENNNSQLVYINTLSEKYLFKQSWFNKNIFGRSYNEFFEDKPPEPKIEDNP